MAIGAAGAAAERTLMVLGDSLSAAYGIAVEEGWVRLLAERLEQEGLPYRVVNASVSGDTTRGALARLPAALERHDPALVVIELGGNDGLRGIPLEETRRNLEAIVRAVREHGAQPILVAMRLPPNYGPAYTERFEALYREVADALSVPLAPFLLERVALEPGLMQADGLHPSAEAQPVILDTLWPHLRPLL